MQRYHRIRHRLLWFLLLPLVAAALVYALVNRVQMPVMKEVPGATGEELGP